MAAKTEKQKLDAMKEQLRQNVEALTELVTVSLKELNEKIDVMMQQAVKVSKTQNELQKAQGMLNHCIGDRIDVLTRRVDDLERIVLGDPPKKVNGCLEQLQNDSSHKSYQ